MGFVLAQFLAVGIAWVTLRIALEGIFRVTAYVARRMKR